MKTWAFRIGGMTCVNCQNRIEKKLKSTPGIGDAAVNFNAGTGVVTYDPAALTLNEIKAAIEELDYQVLDDKTGARGTGVSAQEILGTLVIILSLYALLRGLGIGAVTSAFPLAEAGMDYGMLFLIGLITSVHCAAMCGGINLSQCIPGSAAAPVERPLSPGRLNILFPSISYNAGRVISYTIVGTIAGALGQAVTLSGRFQGLVQLGAGVFMMILGINMLGIFPVLRRFNLRMPRIFARKIDEQKAARKNPLFIGLLNGFMPCGPLQAMQLYALSTGSPLAGGVSMFLFSMGTVPLMFGLGVLSSLLSSASRGRAVSAGVRKAGAILITVMGMTMFTYGFNLSGFSSPLSFVDTAMAGINPFAQKAGWKRNEASAPAAGTPFQIEDGVQIVNSTLSGGRYPAITVQAGIPVQWRINAPAGSINGCNNRMIIREYGIEHRFTPGENVIEFTPAKTGKFPYSCWMGMIRSSITVVEEGQAPADTGGDGLSPSPAGVTIPAGSVALAEIREDGRYQTVKTSLRDDGIEPAILVMQRGIPAAWTINNDSLDPGNSRLIFPAYYTHLDMEQGDNTVQLMPVEDFDFSTADNVFYGYVKVVDDLDTADIDAIKEEVSDYETLIYPDSYFEAAARSVSCCVR
ncbi:MAG: sulfite exporter TauE/SafE family protein [Treponema sp.]|jgi:sulfite exporter TauE/SafE/copper chaperone CopZ|nr:sulfite exporter TauE/SafE family protein [Treponema sp.]